jgi:hypothetical protein
VKKDDDGHLWKMRAAVMFGRSLALGPMRSRVVSCALLSTSRPAAIDSVQSGGNKRRTVTLIPGDGVGPEMAGEEEKLHN